MKRKTWLSIALSLGLIFALLVPAAALRAEDAPGGKILCPYCGTETPATGKFCGACGKRLPAPEGEAPAVVPAEPPAEAAIPPEAAPAPPAPRVYPTEADSTTAKTLFESGLRMMTTKQYGLASVCFRQVVESYPGSAYARHSVELQAACDSLDQAEAPKPRKEISGSDFLGGFVGGIVGVLGLVVFIALIAAGN
jgi:hypothetical protein